MNKIWFYKNKNRQLEEKFKGCAFGGRVAIFLECQIHIATKIAGVELVIESLEQ